MAPRICGACGADLNQRPHYPWCPNAGWVPFDLWIDTQATYSTLRVDNGRGIEVHAWFDPTPSRDFTGWETPGAEARNGLKGRRT